MLKCTKHPHFFMPLTTQNNEFKPRAQLLKLLNYHSYMKVRKILVFYFTVTK